MKGKSLRPLLAFVAVLLISVVSTTIVFAHPAVGHAANRLSSAFGKASYGLGPEYDINDLYFIKPLPDPTTLTDTEKYMLAGLTEDGPANARRPWITEIYQAVSGYYTLTGILPSEFSADIMLELAADPDNVSQDSLDIFKSPITDTYPRLNAREFSPGNVYIRPVTEEEKQHFASINETFQQLWYDGVWEDPHQQAEFQVMTIGDVFYMRVYGESGVIHTGLHFMWTDQ